MSNGADGPGVTAPGAGTPPPKGGTGPKPRFTQKHLVAIGVVVALLVGAIGGMLLISNQDDPEQEFLLEPISSTGENPFMESVGTDVPAVEPPDDVGGDVPADTDGLYGGTLDQASCDADRMVAFLEGNPAEAQAWADVQGIAPSAIATFVADLTPVILRSDTAVTNHGFTNGVANPIPAVLQAGTAVMVDRFGVPRVKCFCGNPLLKPPRRTATVTYKGRRWTGFQETNITIVQATTVEINVFVLVDIETNTAFTRPAGTDGSDDGPAPGDETPETPDPTIPAMTAPTATTTPPPASVEDGTYTGTIEATCSGVSGSAPVTVTISGAATTITIAGDGGSATGPIAADGSFSVSVEGGTITGQVTPEAVTGDFAQEGCTGTMNVPLG